MLVQNLLLCSCWAPACGQSVLTHFSVQAVAPGAAFVTQRNRSTRASALVLFCVGAACVALIGTVSNAGNKLQTSLATSKALELPADFMHSKDYATTSYLAASARTLSATARGIMQDAQMHLVSGSGETQLSWVPPAIKQQLVAAPPKPAAVASVLHSMNVDVSNAPATKAPAAKAPVAASAAKPALADAPAAAAATPAVDSTPAATSSKTQALQDEETADAAPAEEAAPAEAPAAEGADAAATTDESGGATAEPEHSAAFGATGKDVFGGKNSTVVGFLGFSKTEPGIFGIPFPVIMFLGVLSGASLCVTTGCLIARNTDILKVNKEEAGAASKPVDEEEDTKGYSWRTEHKEEVV